MFVKKQASVSALRLLDLDSQDFVTATPLPKYKEAINDFADPDILNAYQICLGFEAEAIEKEESNVKYSKNKPKSKATGNIIKPGDAIIRARILGYLLYFAPSDEALEYVRTSIVDCNKEYETLYDLGDHFMIYFIRAFKKLKGRVTPQTTSQSSHASFNTHREKILATLKETPANHKEAKERALLRDRYQCLMTKKYDKKASHVKRRDAREAGGSSHTECAHILPDSITLNVEGAENKARAEYASSVLAVLSRFGYDIKNIEGPKVHSLFNVMTMEKNSHDFFDRLEAYFESTDIPNQYNPKAFDIDTILPAVVTFTSEDYENLPVPSPELLALHATCAKVARLSGAAEYLDKFDSDLDSMEVLAWDGSSFEVLQHAIWENLGGKPVDVGG